MGRRPEGWWDARAQRWFVRLGEPSLTNGKSLPVMLRGEDGEPVEQDDERGKKRAIERLIHTKRMRRSFTGTTAREICRLYVAWHKQQGSATRTVKDHWRHLKYFCMFERNGIAYGDKRAVDIMPEDLAAIQETGRGQLRQLFSSVLACWKWASQSILGRKPSVLIEVNPLEKVKRIAPGAPTDKVLEWEDARRILRMSRGYAHTKAKTRPERTRATRWTKVACLTMMAYTGGRTKEIVTMEWDDIQWTKGIFIIPWQRTKSRKSRKDRVIDIRPRMMRLLKVIRDCKHRHPKYVFCCRWHESIEEREREFWRWIREDLKPHIEAKVAEFNDNAKNKDVRISLPSGWQPYWMRHSFATEAYEVVGREGAKALGHSPDVMEDRYVHIRAKHIKSIGDSVEKSRKAKNAKANS